MKKLTVWLSTLVVAIIGILCLVACGGDPVGTYKFDSMSGKMEGVSIDVKVGDKLMGMIELTEDYMVIEIKEDNTYTMKMAGQNAGSGTWEQSGSKIILKATGDADVEATLSGSELTFENEGLQVTLKK
ncbi:MAG: hypothetical protein K2L87_04050 [Clostridiales bacterium]|nr:hypothetical protein [Clostridiales bacterium]